MSSIIIISIVILEDKEWSHAIIQQVFYPKMLQINKSKVLQYYK